MRYFERRIETRAGLCIKNGERYSWDQLSPTEMALTCPFSASEKDFQVIREKYTTLLQEVLEIIKDSDPENVACLNVDLFWIR